MSNYLQNQLPMPLYFNMAWVAYNLSADAQDAYEIADIYTILTKCMECKTETMLSEIVGGLERLSKDATNDTIELISGYNDGPKNG